MQVLTTLLLLLLLDDEVPPPPPLEEEPPTLLPPGEELPALAALLLDALRPALPPLGMLLLELPPEPARDELLLEPPAPALERDELSDVPPEDELLPPLVAPPLSESLPADLVQVARERAVPRSRTENDREEARGDSMKSEVTPQNACGKQGRDLARLRAAPGQGVSQQGDRPCSGHPEIGNQRRGSFSCAYALPPCPPKTRGPGSMMGLLSGCGVG